MLTPGHKQLAPHLHARPARRALVARSPEPKGDR